MCYRCVCWDGGAAKTTFARGTFLMRRPGDDITHFPGFMCMRRNTESTIALRSRPRSRATSRVSVPQPRGPRHNIAPKGPGSVVYLPPRPGNNQRGLPLLSVSCWREHCDSILHERPKRRDRPVRCMVCIITRGIYVIWMYLVDVSTAALPYFNKRLQRARQSVVSWCVS